MRATVLVLACLVLALTPIDVGSQSLAGLSGPAFDAAYIRFLYQQSSDIAALANLAKDRATLPELKNQVRAVWRTNSNESKAFERWLNTGFLTFNEQQWYCQQQYWYGSYSYDPRCWGMILPRGPIGRFGFFVY